MTVYTCGGLFFHISLVECNLLHFRCSRTQSPFCLPFCSSIRSVCFYSHHCRMSAETEGIRFSFVGKREEERGTEKWGFAGFYLPVFNRLLSLFRKSTFPMDFSYSLTRVIWLPNCRGA